MCLKNIPSHCSSLDTKQYQAMHTSKISPQCGHYSNNENNSDGKCSRIVTREFRFVLFCFFSFELFNKLPSLSMSKKFEN